MSLDGKHALLWSAMNTSHFFSEVRPVGKTLNVNAHTPSVDSIRELAVNCNGTKVIVLTTQVTESLLSVPRSLLPS